MAEAARAAVETGGAPTPAQPFLLGLIGSPIMSSAAPAMHEAAAEALGLRAQYRLIDVAGADEAKLSAMLEGVRLLGRGNSLLVAGDKAPSRVRGESSFHLVERGYGRFARVVHLHRPCDASKARAKFVHGELHVAVPKVADRRGHTFTIAISTETPSA